MSLSRRWRSSATEGPSFIAGGPSVPLRGPPPHEWGGKHCLRSRTKASLAPPQGGGVPPQAARGLSAQPLAASVAAIFPRTPLTKRPASSPEKVLASSIDSLIAALTGTSCAIAIS